MDEQQLLELKPELDTFLGRFAPLFGTPQNQSHARRFVQGLLLGGERRNSENIAQAISGSHARNLQAFITTGVRLDSSVLSELRSAVLRVLADDDAVWNSDETGFPKKGTKPVGVKRQYSGPLGRTDNCQVAVFANYSSRHGHALVDRRLFLPAEWASDKDRRAEAGVPESVIFRTKPELALAMPADAVASGVPFRWVGGDSVYGISPAFVQGTRELGKWYVLDTASDMRVWTAEPRVVAADQRPYSGRGRRCTRPSVVGESRTVEEVAGSLPASAWQRVMAGEGSQGPRMYEYAEVGVWFSEGGVPGPRERLLVRRGMGQAQELKYHRSNAPAEVGLEKLAAVRGTRWTIEEDFRCAKGECGLDEYETRGWVGWHHHTALSMLALAFLVIQRRRTGEKMRADDGTGGEGVVGPPVGSEGMGRGGNPAVVPVETRTPPKSRGKSPKAAACQTAPSVK